MHFLTRKQAYHIGFVELVYGVGTGKLAVHLTLEHGLVHFVVQQLDAAQQLTGFCCQVMQHVHLGALHAVPALHQTCAYALNIVLQAQ